jgi:hypothetical protein
VSLGPGVYQVRVAARDGGNGSTGSSNQWIEIPDYSRDRLLLSTILLSERLPSSGADAGGQFALNTSRSFRAPSRLAAMVQIYGAKRRPESAPPQVWATTRLYQGDRLVVDGPARIVDASGMVDPAKLSHAATLDLGGLPPGLYTLELSVADRIANTTASEQIRLTIQ